MNTLQKAKVTPIMLPTTEKTQTLAFCQIHLETQTTPKSQLVEFVATPAELHNLINLLQHHADGIESINQEMEE